MSFLNLPLVVRQIIFDFASLDSVRYSNPTENHLQNRLQTSLWPPAEPRISQLPYREYLIPVYVMNPQGHTWAQTQS